MLDIDMRAALCHYYNIIGHMTIRLSKDDFLYILNRNQIRISLCFHDVITDIITPESTIPVDLTDTQHRRPLC